VPSKPSSFRVIKFDGRQAVLLSSLGSDLLSLCNEPPLSLSSLTDGFSCGVVSLLGHEPLVIFLNLAWIATLHPPYRSLSNGLLASFLVS